MSTNSVNKLCQPTLKIYYVDQNTQLRTTKNSSCYLRNLIDVCSGKSNYSPQQIWPEYIGEYTGATTNPSHQVNIQVGKIKFNVTVTIMIASQDMPPEHIHTQTRISTLLDTHNLLRHFDKFFDNKPFQQIILNSDNKLCQQFRTVK